MRRILIVFVVTGVAMVLIFRGSGWYADHAALPRYCSDPGLAVGIVRDILNGKTSGYTSEKHNFLVSSKLIYLVPRNDQEPLEAYLARLKERISQACSA